MIADIVEIIGLILAILLAPEDTANIGLTYGSWAKAGRIRQYCLQTFEVTEIAFTKGHKETNSLNTRNIDTQGLQLLMMEQIHILWTYLWEVVYPLNFHRLCFYPLAIFPIAFATIMEHIGDMCAIQSTVGKNFIKDPGLHRTLCGDGLATLLASVFGAPANTTYGENTGVLNLTRVFDPAVIRLAACFAILLSFCPKFACLIALMPAATIGGVSLILYGMISAVGVRNLVETSVDFSSSRNVFVAALILVVSIGVQYGTDGGVQIGPITFSGLALAALVGIFLNAILPDQLGMKVKSFNGKDKPHLKR